MELTLFHGTDGANAASILEHGLRSSTNGRLGAGVYCTDDEEVAKKIARCRGLMFIVKCTVNVGKVADFGDGPTDGTWRDKGFDSATAAHPPWAGVTHNFTEICIADSSRVKVVGVEGMVSPPGPFAAGPHFIINAGCQKFLDSNDGDAVALWGDGIDIGDYPDNIRWELRPVAGAANSYYIVNRAHQKFLDTHGQTGGKGAWLWRGAHWLDVGSIPENLQWRLEPTGAADTYFVVNVGHSKYLDSHGDDVWVWGDGRDAGDHPAYISWRIVVAP